MAVVEGRFSPAPIRGRLQATRPASLGLKKPQALPTAGRRALHGQLYSCSFGFSEGKFSRASDGLVLGPAVPRGPSPTSSSAGRCDLDFMFFRIRKCRV